MKYILLITLLIICVQNATISNDIKDLEKKITLSSQILTEFQKVQQDIATRTEITVNDWETIIEALNIIIKGNDTLSSVLFCLKKEPHSEKLAHLLALENRIKKNFDTARKITEFLQNKENELEIM